jgi:hypothetical protein
MHALLVAVLLTTGSPEPALVSGECVTCAPRQRHDWMMNATNRLPPEEYQYRIGCGSAQRHCSTCRGPGTGLYYNYRLEFDYPWFSPRRPQTIELYPPPHLEGPEEVPAAETLPASYSSRSVRLQRRR